MKRLVLLAAIVALLLATASSASAFHRHRHRRGCWGSCPYGYSNPHGISGPIYASPTVRAYGSIYSVPRAEAGVGYGTYRYPSYGFGYPMAYPGYSYFPGGWSGYGIYPYNPQTWYGYGSGLRMY